MATWRVLILNKPKFTDHPGKSLEKEWKHEKLAGAPKIRVGQAYEVAGDLSPSDMAGIAEKLLVDPITQEAVFPASEKKNGVKIQRAEVWPKPGVSDPVADTVAIGAKDLGVGGVKSVHSGAVYEFTGKAARKDIKHFCENYLMNPLVQKVEIN